MASPSAVAIVTGSDTVSTLVGCVESLARSLPAGCDVVVACSLVPERIRERARDAAGERRITILHADAWRNQNVWRNEALASLRPYDFYFFLDSDSRIEPGTLERHLETHERAGADLVGGIVYYGEDVDLGRAGESIVHFGGGEIRYRPDADGRPGMEQIHHWVGRRADEMRAALGDAPLEANLLELHGLTLTRRAVEALSPFDPELVSMEHVDLCLQARERGLAVVLDPGAGVRYEGAAQRLCDVEPYRRHWATEDARHAARHFAAKHGYPEDCELVRSQIEWNRAHYESIGVVTRPSFPAPRLEDLHDHPYAQTWPQLVEQLRRQGWDLRELKAVERHYAIGRRLADGLYRACGKPFVEHLVGTASILAAHGAPPVLVHCASMHHAYGPDGSVARRDGDDLAHLRLEGDVDRILRAYARERFGAPPPEGADDRALYPVPRACALILRVANEIEERLDGAAVLARKPYEPAGLLAHAREILPFLGYDSLLAAFEAALALDEALAGSLPDELVAGRTHAYRLHDESTPDVLALPDEKWVEVAEYLRREGRAEHVAVAPEEFLYLCGGIGREFLAASPWDGLPAEAIVAVHKGRLEYHAEEALSALLSATPIWANEVFVLFSRSGGALPDHQQVHLAPIRARVGDGTPAVGARRRSRLWSRLAGGLRGGLGRSA